MTNRQSTFDIPDSDGATFLAAINDALQALAAKSVGTAAPGTTWEFQDWMDLTSKFTKARDSGNAAWVINGRTDLLRPLWDGFLFGGIVSNDVSTPNTVLDFAAGKCVDSSGTYPMVWSAFTKILNSSGSWTAGTGQNGLFTGARANSTWYYPMVIVKSSDGSVDGGFDTSISGANIPAGYSGYRRLGAIKTDSSGNILGFTQTGEEFILKVPIRDVGGTSIGTGSRTTLTLNSVPPGVSVFAILTATIAAATAANDIIFLSSLDQTDAAALNGLQAEMLGQVGGVSVALGRLMIHTNTAQQIGARAASNANALHVFTNGWRDLLGRYS